MRAVRIQDYEARLSIADVGMPVPGDGEVLVRIHAAALNPLDVKLQRGFMQAFFPLRFPYTLGTDFSGVVEQVGANVPIWRPGDAVIGRTDPTAGGALADHVVVSASSLAPPPAGLSLQQAAGIPTAAGTAWQGLFEVANLQQGQKILIHAGAGGVGSFAIQFARQAGAEVVATASGDGLDIARRLGARKTIDHRSEDFGKAVTEADVVFDTIGGETQERSFGVLRAGGLLLAAAAPPDEATAKAHDVRAAFVFHSSDGKRLGKVAAEIASGGIEVLVDRIGPLEDVAEAFERQASGHARGKIILTMA